MGLIVAIATTIEPSYPESPRGSAPSPPLCSTLTRPPLNSLPWADGKVIFLSHLLTTSPHLPLPYPLPRWNYASPQRLSRPRKIARWSISLRPLLGADLLSCMVWGRKKPGVSWGSCLGDWCQILRGIIVRGCILFPRQVIIRVRFWCCGIINIYVFTIKVHLLKTIDRNHLA